MSDTLSLPLKIYEQYSQATGNLISRCIVDAEDRPVCSMYPLTNLELDRPYAEEIVRAVNSHDELLAACEDTLGWLQHPENRNLIRMRLGESAGYDKTIRQGSKAIATAKGEA